MINILYVVILLLSNVAHACTDIRITANDGAVVIARSMEFAIDLKSNVRSRTNNHDFNTKLQDNSKGLSWQGKYGYVYLDALGVDIAIEGMNEEGLSFEALYLPDLAQYQTQIKGKENKTLPYIYLGDWILSNFRNVSEVRAAISNINVTSIKIPQTKNNILPLHFSVHDANGDSIVIEYIAGNLHIYDNKIGIMTNDPNYDWHITNLNNYVNLKPTNPKPVVTKGMTFVATGQGGGMVGLPGDISPPSRFVKMAIFSAVVKPAIDGPQAVNLLQHMINNVDIPFGLARETGSENYTSEYTQWTVFKDLKNRVLYFHTYRNTNLRKIDISKIDFSSNKNLIMPLDSSEEIVIDVTNKFLQTRG